MTFLPIVDRELRVAARRRGTYWTRALSALGAILVGGFCYLTNLHSPAYEFGKNLFVMLAWCSIPYCLFAGVRLTADSLSEEKREGTLGLLFLTDLKGYDVVLGKLAATSVSGFFGLLSIFPVLAVPLLMGGITSGEFWRMALSLANTFLFGLAIGIFMSAISKSSRKSMAGTLVVILIFAAAVPLCVTAIPYLARIRSLTEATLLTWQFSSFWTSFDSEYNGAGTPKYFGVHYYWCSVAVLHLMTWMFLVLACLVAPRSWQDRPVGAAWARWLEKWHKWNYGDSGERNAFRARLLDVNAFYWLAARTRLKPALVWGGLGIVACLWSWGWAEERNDRFNVFVYILTAVVVNTMLKLWVASEAGRRLGEDRKIGALELLLSTPLTVRDILRGQLMALRRQFLGPVVVVLVIEVTFLVAAVRKEADANDPGFISVWLAGMAMLLLDVVALSWVGMWVALTTKNPNRATSLTVLRVLVLPWVIWFVVTVVFASLASVRGGTGFDPGWKFLLGLWFGIGVLVDVGFGLSARHQLLTMFRQVAMQRYTPGQSWLKRIFSGSKAPAMELPRVAVE